MVDKFAKDATIQSPMRKKKLKILDGDAVLSILRKKQAERTSADFASNLGISQAYLSEIYAGKKAPGIRVLEHIGLRRVMMYQEVA